MPPTRGKAASGPKRSLVFKPPLRVSDASTSRRTSGLSDSYSNANTTAITISSDVEEFDGDSINEDDVEQSYLATKVTNRRSTVQSGPATPRRQSTNRLLPPEENPAAVMEENPDAPAVPRNLLVRILHENLEDKNMKINKEAMTVVESYVKIFVKEAIARSRHETREKAKKTGGYGDDWLQVEDLEKIAPQLMLDF
jgi:CENP-S associating Centromere protein X